MGSELAGSPGNILGKSLGSGVSASMLGGNFANGVKYGLMGAIRSEAFNYMTTETDKLASAYWGADANKDANGNIWTFGGRGCASGGDGQCDSLLSWVTMKPEYSAKGDDTWNNKYFGVRLGEIPIVGTFLNMVSKTHDWLNSALTLNNLYSAEGARDFGTLENTVMDVASLAGMLPAAKFTANALWQPPLKR